MNWKINITLIIGAHLPQRDNLKTLLQRATKILNSLFLSLSRPYFKRRTPTNGEMWKQLNTISVTVYIKARVKHFGAYQINYGSIWSKIWSLSSKRIMWHKYNLTTMNVGRHKMPITFSLHLPLCLAYSTLLMLTVFHSPIFCFFICI